MAYGLAKQNNVETQDNSLMCSAHGCPNKWSVQIESRLCSYHAWSEPKLWPSITERIRNEGNWQLEKKFETSRDNYPGDWKGWAKRLRDRHEAGEKLNESQIRCYKSALGVFA